MKILHTADWHLGKIVHYLHMTEDQRFILNEFLSIVKRVKPDAVIIAGDLYDRSIPPKEAVELLNQVLTRLTNELAVPVLAISGNHDSPDRLEFGAELFRKQGLYLETKLKKNREPITLYDDDGPVHFHLIPYLEPAEVAYVFEDDRIKTHHQAAEQLIKDIHDRFNMAERHIWVGHAFLAGGMETDSEERLSMIGGSPYVEAGLFQSFTYTALGHLHQPQQVTSPSIRYSGSILKYSFSEARHHKSVTLVELPPEGRPIIDKIPLVPMRDFEIVEGYFEELMKGEAASSMENYLHIRLLDDGQLIDPMGKLRKIYPNILYLERKNVARDQQLSELNKMKERQQMSHLDLIASFYEELKGTSMPEERKHLVQQAIAALKETERGR
ncbi:exonuclease SbcCD subunit D [Halobacillus salinarum]|uniref:Nuclease SbcCD subunit D n=1 Tax=Halobacillus salinarum TaxID=2932257 RepID=A0ABY4EGN2_9BACI|nr:exonuclease SbcCD subunit D [Halobacillus salinarum]UOQ42779.1 exonuclease SbcCD subunit D [Halobacillus salinarum]